MDNIYQILGERKLTPAEQQLEDQLRLSSLKKQLAVASAVPIPTLPNIPDAKFLRPQDSDYLKYLPLHNIRNDVAPALRIVCTSTQAVSDSIKWVADNDLPLALRSGGHCYEGFSQSSSVVIDLRRMGLTVVDSANETVAVSAGADLIKVYRKVAAQGFAFAAGSCPTVGVAGHTLGGGMGLLGRRFGLACDNLREVRLVDANGSIIVANENNHADHYWACRGGGGGSFSVATRFVFDIHKLSHVHTFGITWKFSDTASYQTKAVDVFNAWQRWAPEAPQSITSIMLVQKFSNSEIRLRCIGQSTGTESQLKNEVDTNLIVHQPSSPLRIRKKTFIKAVEDYSGSFDYQSIFMEGKSDVVTQPLSPDAIQTMFDALMAIPKGHVVAICDAYGGAISDVPEKVTAFPHRGNKTWAVQYYSRWSKASQTATRLASIEQVFAAMRPFMSGAAYVNYPDANLPDYASSYWMGNLSRLKQIKESVDPENFFQHGQSVPLP